MLDHIKFTKLIFILKAVDNIILPEYKGAVFRGGFGYTFKRIVCVQRGNKDCKGCLLEKTCVYSYIFETPLPEDSEVLRLNKNVPHPFVLEPPQDNRRFIKKQDLFQFNISLIGKAIDYLPYIIFTFIELGKSGIGTKPTNLDTTDKTRKRSVRGQYNLMNVQSLDINGKTQSIYNNEQQTVENNYHILQGADLNHIKDNDKNRNQINVNFITPCRIKFNDKISNNIGFHLIIRNLLRRLSSISYFHCNKELECDYQAIIEESKEIKTTNSNLKWYEWDRFSTRQNQKMNLGGLLGNVTFQGDLTPFLQLLRLGEYLHVGKNTSFGLGRYVLS